MLLVLEIADKSFSGGTENLQAALLHVHHLER